MTTERRIVELEVDASKAVRGYNDTERAAEGAAGSLDELASKFSANIKVSEHSVRASDRLTSSFAKLERQLDPVAAAHDRLRRQQELLDRAMTGGILSLDRHSQLLDMARRRADAAAAGAAGHSAALTGMSRAA
ncbi:MAG: hypothetical protein HQL39_18385, partial [Alphaproteobacteria bacterium]|nr:hypothetical protein [Alphaproteobacteria bacterium]